MSDKSAEIIPITLSDDIMAQYSYEALLKRTYDTLLPIVTAFITTGFSKLLMDFNTELLNILEYITHHPSTDGIPPMDYITKHITNLVSMHPSRQINRNAAYEANTLVSIDLRLAHSIKAYLSAKYHQMIDPKKEIRRLLYLQYFKQFAEHKLNPTNKFTQGVFLGVIRQIAFHGEPEDFPELLTLFPDTVSLHRIRKISDAPPINPTSDTTHILMLDPEFSILHSDMTMKVIAKGVYLRSGMSSALLQLGANKRYPELRVQLLQLDNRLEWIHDAMIHPPYFVNALTQLMTDLKINETIYAICVVETFNAAIRELANRLPTRLSPDRYKPDLTAAIYQ